MVERRFDLTKDAVTATEIASGAVGTDELADSSVTTAKIVDAAVTTAKIADANVTTAKLASDAVKVTIPIVGVHDQTGLAADSTGVKYEGPRFKIDTTGLKSATLRGTWSASNTDSVTAIELYDVTGAAVVGSISGNTGSDTEGSITISNITSGNLHELRVNVTTASATSGATTDVKYGVLELVYGFS